MTIRDIIREVLVSKYGPRVAAAMVADADKKHPQSATLYLAEVPAHLEQPLRDEWARCIAGRKEKSSDRFKELMSQVVDHATRTQ